jgi:hypothetical protein
MIGAGPVMRKKGKLKMKASLTMLLKTHVEKMSLFGFATMSMKANALPEVCHDVVENAGTYGMARA